MQTSVSYTCGERGIAYTPVSQNMYIYTFTYSNYLVMVHNLLAKGRLSQLFSQMNGASDLCNFAALSGAVCMSSNGHLRELEPE